MPYPKIFSSFFFRRGQHYSAATSAPPFASQLRFRRYSRLTEALSEAPYRVSPSNTPGAVLFESSSNSTTLSSRDALFTVNLGTLVTCGNQVPQLVAVFLAVYEPPQPASSKHNIIRRPCFLHPKSYSSCHIEPRRGPHPSQSEHHNVYDTHTSPERSTCFCATGSSYWHQPERQIQSRFATLTW